MIQSLKLCKTEEVKGKDCYLYDVTLDDGTEHLLGFVPDGDKSLVVNPQRTFPEDRYKEFMNELATYSLPFPLKENYWYFKKPSEEEYHNLHQEVLLQMLKQANGLPVMDK